MSKMSEVAAAKDRMAEIDAVDFWSLSDEAQDTLRGEYLQVRNVLLAFYGRDADCALIDPWACESFSDLYKDETGIRPRGVFSYATVHALIAKTQVDPAEAEQREAGVEGDRFDPDLESLPDDDDTVDYAAIDFQDKYGSSPFAALAVLLETAQ
jgi:hypothetical protein